ncbi:lysophospholipid acyltransferase family protein [Georgenia sp. Z1491]|uniref:lysophospholipid acyltransferase family protein n=1 Tax=Georgenia sp. Z1491 TaxID=3416707 RepID=UPI003CED9315
MTDKDTRSRGRRTSADDILRWGPVWSRRVGQVLAHGWWRTRIVGAENVPATGQVIVASNHTGIVDGPLLHGALPRGSHMIIKQEFWDSPLGFLMTLAGQIPVDRRAGRNALQIAKQFLSEGRLVGIFPEGSRGRGDASQVHAGVAWLAVQSGAPVVPVAILGTRPPGTPRSYVSPPRSRLTVVIGEPVAVEVPSGASGRTAITAAMEQIGRALSAHVADSVERTGIPLPDDEDPR